MDQELHLTCERAKSRLLEISDFVQDCNAGSEDWGRRHRIPLYTSWTLLLYAALEASIKELGAASQKVLRQANLSPLDFGPRTRKIYADRILAALNASSRFDRNAASVAYRAPLPEGADGIESIIRGAYSKDWHEVSPMFDIEGNVWSSRVEELLNRLDPPPEWLSWSREPWQEGSQSLYSIIDDLVRERNSLAHGDIPLQTKSIDDFLGLISAVSEYVIRVHETLQRILAVQVPPELHVRIGELDPAESLAPETAAFRTVDASISLGDRFLSLDLDGDYERRVRSVSIVRVKTIRSHGKTLEQVRVGSEKVAVHFNRSVSGMSLVELL